MTKMIVFFTMMLTSFTAAATKKHIFEFTASDTISNSYYSHLRVVDQRADTSRIGDARRQDYVTFSPLGSELSAYFKACLVQPPAADNELLLVLDKFSIDDCPNLVPMGTIYVRGDFYRVTKGEYFYLGRVDKFLEIVVGNHRPSVFEGEVQHCIIDLFSEYAGMLINDRYPASVKEEQAVTKFSAEKAGCAIYHTDSFKKGIYRNVEQFLNNQPVDTPFMGVLLGIEGVHHYKYYYLNARGKRGERINEEDYFAIYDGKKWTSSNDGYAAIMNYRNGDFYTAKQFYGAPNLTKTHHMYFIPVPGFGLLGAIFVIAAVGAVSGMQAHSANTVPCIYESRFDPTLRAFSPTRRLD